MLGNNRFRRLRQNALLRDLVAETTLRPHQLILPLFVKENDAPPAAPSFSAFKRHTLAELPYIVDSAQKVGITTIALFPHVPEHKKDEKGSEALKENNLICRALAALAGKNIQIIVDIALDPYTTHGHDGLYRNQDVQNDETVKVLAQQALLFAQAGATILAPSDMMDFRILHIRNTLEAQGFQHVVLLSYAAKFASSFYGPFRNAVGAAPLVGDKKTYQLDYRNTKEALKEAQQDVCEGADILMVKPALPYLDILWQIKQTVSVPVFAYQVSGEYAMLHENIPVFLESLYSIKRAGASAILTYGALDIAPLL